MDHPTVVEALEELDAVEPAGFVDAPEPGDFVDDDAIGSPAMWNVGNGVC